MYNILALLASLIIPIIILKKDVKKEATIKNFIRSNKRNLIIYICFVVGFAARLMFITQFPNGLNVDEASSGYEAYSILKYGIDRNGNFMPVFLEAWGGGQNALYTYLMIPFVKILGLNILSVRLPMAIIGCISLFVMYKILKQSENQKITTIGVIFFAITPWHIMKSRWGLESNIFPDMVLYATYFMIQYVKNKKIKNMYISAIILGLCTYSYGTSYFFIPIFIVSVLGYMLIKKQIQIKHCIGIMSVIFVISLPIILFLIINTFDLKPIKCVFTIPRVVQNRYEELSSVFSKQFVNKSLSNFAQSLKMMITQNDGLGWNQFTIFGITYIVTLPFTIIGIYQGLKNNQGFIFNIWFISAFLLMFAVEPNINRLNIAMIPIIYYTTMGIYIAFKKSELLKIYVPIIIISLFVCFEITYFTTDWSKFFTFSDNIENVIKYVDKIDTEKVYFEYSFKEPYIYVCFYNKINTNDFVNTVKYKNNIKSFDSVVSFGKYNFYIPDEIEDDAIYVIKSKNEKKYNFAEEEWKKIYIDDFTILVKEE